MRRRDLRPQAGLILVLVLSWGLTGCYTQLRMTDDTAETPRTEPSARQTQAPDAGADEAPTYADEYRRSVASGGASAGDFDPASPVASLRRATPDTTADLVSLARDLQEARAYADISFAEYREGVRFFRTNHPAFYGNYFGDPLYATYDVQYHRTARAALAASRAIHPENSFWRIDGFFCAPYSYDPAFGCRGLSFAPSEFFVLPTSLAFHGTGRFGRAGVAPRPPALSSLYTWPWGHSYATSGYGFGGWGASAYGSDRVGPFVADDGRRDDRGDALRGSTIGRGGTSAPSGPGRSARRATAEARGEAGRDDTGERSSSGLAPDASLRTGALSSIESVTLEPVRVSGADIQDASREQKLRTFRALKRIAEETDGGTLSIEQRDEISEHVRRLIRAQREDLSARQDGRSRTRSPNAPNMGRGSQGASERRGSRVGRGNSGSGGRASRSGGRDRQSSGDAGRDRSRSRSDDSGGRR